jgi:hypothetical protein
MREIHPTKVLAPAQEITGRIVGPAMPSPAESKLREDFVALEARCKSLEDRLEARIAELEQVEERVKTVILDREKHLVGRLETLEGQWEEEAISWFKRVWRWLSGRF